MKSIFESLRAARHIELLILIVLLAALALFMLGGARREPAGGTDVEARLERLLKRIEGVEDVDVMITLGDDDRPAGAAVVSDRPLTVRATLEIQSAIQALLDIDLNRIRVIGRGGL